MKRLDFLKLFAMAPLSVSAMRLQDLNLLSTTLSVSKKMPALFLGHGSPMNAIEDNEFVQGFKNIVKEIPKPQLIICISAHWETKGTLITAMPMPKTIHDFGGFPKALFDVEYPAKGSPEMAKKTKEVIKSTEVQLDNTWGLDHGAWSVIKHLYPKADVPVIQLSIDYTKDPQFHYNLGKELTALRNKGVLIIGSGNMVHNLSMIAWDKMQESNYGYDWALEASAQLKSLIVEGNHQPLINYQKLGKALQLAVPTSEHYLPLLYTLGLQQKNEPIALFNDKAVAGSLMMTSVKIG
jgi:4,5-DOPA dioxygenase extradiol